MRIGVLGCGTIASAAVRGIAQDGHVITVSRRNEEHATALAECYANVTIADVKQSNGVIHVIDTVLLPAM